MEEYWYRETALLEGKPVPVLIFKTQIPNSTRSVPGSNPGVAVRRSRLISPVNCSPSTLLKINFKRRRKHTVYLLQSLAYIV